MIKELQSIINDFKYQEALSWYMKHVEGKFFIKEMLQKGDDSYNVLKLKKELNAILLTIPPPNSHIKKTSKKEKLENMIDELREELRDEIQNEIDELKEKIEDHPKPNATKLVNQAAESREELYLEEKWKPLYKEANHYFEQIGHINDKKERMETAYKILNIMDKVEEIWAERDFLKRHGVLPVFENQGIEQMTPEQITQRIMTLRTYISKAKKGILKDERIPEWKAEIEALQRELRK